MNRCLYCYNPLETNNSTFHEKCSKTFFGSKEIPLLDFSNNDLEKMAFQIIQSNNAVTGVQPKLSLHLENKKNEPTRLTVVGFKGDYILKPQTEQYHFLPEVEDLTMHLAQIAKIKTVPHSLVYLNNKEIAYLTQRIDRKGNEKLHMEDFCQISERLTEHKYQGSYEQIAKLITKYSSYPGLDLVSFWEIVLFSYLTGNADMHLKNFSLLYNNNNIQLSPAYDLVATKIVNPLDDEDLALTLNAKKRKLNRYDFQIAFSNSKLEPKQQENIFSKFFKVNKQWKIKIENSFLNKEYKNKYLEMIDLTFSTIY